MQIFASQNTIGLNPTFLQNAILSLMKLKTNIPSLPVKELANSATLYLFNGLELSVYYLFIHKHNLQENHLQ